MSTSGRKYDEMLLAKLASGATHQQAAEAAGCSERTVNRRLLDPKFSAKLREVRNQLFEAAMGRIFATAPAAANTLTMLLARDTPPTTRLGAARTVLESTLKFREQHDLEERLKVIEDRLATQKKR